MNTLRGLGIYFIVYVVLALCIEMTMLINVAIALIAVTINILFVDRIVAKIKEMIHELL